MLATLSSAIHAALHVYFRFAELKKILALDPFL